MFRIRGRRVGPATESHTSQPAAIFQTLAVMIAATILEVAMSHLNVGDAAALIEQQYGIACEPRILSNMLYRRQLDVRKCPIQGGRRLIPRDYLPRIAELLRRSVRIEQPAAGGE
jgi:hypothetical protein